MDSIVGLKQSLNNKDNDRLTFQQYTKIIKRICEKG